MHNKISQIDVSTDQLDILWTYRQNDGNYRDTENYMHIEFNIALKKNEMKLWRANKINKK